MAPKPKDKSKAKEAATDKGGKAAKAAQQINVRHVLCEKHGKKEEALAKLNGGASFDSVAREFSEDKARAGNYLPTFLAIQRACRFGLNEILTCMQVALSGGRPRRVCCPSSLPWLSSSLRPRRIVLSGGSVRLVRDIILSWLRGGSER